MHLLTKYCFECCISATLSFLSMHTWPYCIYYYYFIFKGMVSRLIGSLPSAIGSCIHSFIFFMDTIHSFIYSVTNLVPPSSSVQIWLFFFFEGAHCIRSLNYLGKEWNILSAWLIIDWMVINLFVTNLMIFSHLYTFCHMPF